jgi:DNA modification methylase
MDNMLFETDEKFDLIFSDFIYENEDFSWANKYWNLLKENSLMIAMTDFHTSSELDVYMKKVIGAKRICKYVWYNEWGRGPSNRPHECYDEIFVYTNGKSWHFDKTKIQVPKKTANTKLNLSGRMTKTATCWVDDCVLTTTSKERVKKDDGHLLEWQKPQSMYNRVILPWLKENAKVLDIFAGSMSLGKFCVRNNFDYVGIEYDTKKFELAKKNIYS